jgi:hypothetical protein
MIQPFLQILIGLLLVVGLMSAFVSWVPRKEGM